MLVLVILVIAAIAILACVVLVSLGRGGELGEFPPDVPPLDLPEAGRLSAVDFMALQLPVNLVGYHTQSVDETLRRAATAISERDTRIAVLEQRVSELLSSRLHARQEVYAAPGAGPVTEHRPEAPAEPRELPESGDPVETSGAGVDWDAEGIVRRPTAPAAWHTTHDEPEPADEPEPVEADVEAETETEVKAESDVDESETASENGQHAPATPDENRDEERDEEPVRAALGKDGDEKA
ncbi:hypothetical protein HII36_27635 [Nonomuraea sp. NN258]|uniref:hypothetical protein n=1 Tax=Nonomuraea antri TaxID=2730852 RepID=UPI001568D233|nr:hypothetical protein [Nonomuraea antri]NRQ35576.1 hypothetical protein [Nonomuraea antri]